MNSRTSRLSSLLRVRRIQEDVARAQLLVEAAAERRARESLAQAQDRYAAPEPETGPGPQQTQVFLAAHRRRDALAGSVRLAGAGADAASEATAVARHEWSEAAIRMTALERLEERAESAERTERLAVEQRTSEESGSATRQSRSSRTTSEARP